MLDQQSRHPRLIHAYADAVASHPRLRDFEQRSADPVAVADRDLAVGQPLHGQIFSELPECEIASLQLLFPVTIGIHLIDKHSAVFPTVTGQVTLRVAIDVEPPNHTPALYRLLPHGRVHSLPPPCDLMRTTYVD